MANPTHWGKVAEWYDQLVGEEGSEFHREVIFPGVLRLLSVQPNEGILDVACGQGVFCRVLAQRGARVTGVDASAELIRLARERNSALSTRQGSGEGAEGTKARRHEGTKGGEEEEGSNRSAEADPTTLDAGSALSTQHLTLPEYRVGDARDLSGLAAEHYAAATCILAIQNIDKLPPVFQGISRVLRPGGRVVLVMMHPCFRSPKHSGWGWDEEKQVQYRRVDRYLLPRKEPIVTHPGKKTGEYTWTFHRPMQAYVKALRGAGLLVDAMEEWASHKVSTSGPRAAAENVARQEIPMFLAIRAVKVG